MLSRLTLNGVRPIYLRILCVFVLALAVGWAAVAGTFVSADNNMRLAGFDLSQRPASGQIHVVEMDAASVEAIRQWPWSRAHYAQLVEQLDAAGVRSIVFDVDFSSHSGGTGDAQFASAIHRANSPVVLPAFARSSNYQSKEQLDALPIPELREHAQLASVSIAPDADGFIRRMPFGTISADTPRPSLSSFLAGRGGSADAHFPIDFGIDVFSIPRHSFIDIKRGEFDPAELRGKDVLIGATAVEMGDRYAVPRYGVTPGVFVQALAGETLLRGEPSYGSWILPLTLAVIFGVFALGAKTYPAAAIRTLGAFSLLVGSWQYAYQALHIWFEIAPALALTLLVGAGRGLVIARRAYQLARQTDRETGLANGLALKAEIADSDNGYVIAAVIDDIAALKAVLGAEDFARLIRRVVERLSVSTQGACIHRIDNRTLAWQSDAQLCEIEEHSAGLRSIMRSPIEIAGRRVDVSLAIGVAEISQPKCIENASHAAAEALHKGDAWRMFEADNRHQLERQISLMGELDDALHEGHMSVFYQPKQELRSGQITCAEALIRWEHPEKGMLPPDSFIPLAEESGRVEDLTLFVVRKTIEDMRSWCERGLVLGTAVNISARLLSSKSFAARVEKLIDDLGAPNSRLTFEVTESAELEDSETAIATLNRFKRRGIAISMDDYGTGQSTLNYIKQLPLSELKIDRSFVQYAHKDRNDAMLVRSTVQLAHELGLKVVAEGIEEVECLDFLRSIDCDYAQGYFIGKPMRANELEQLVDRLERAVA